ncbi:MAG TPA: septum formation initiator family protein [Candidatus Binataceae bacterium]|nr:septum formation initiator family protein [Candidatus Binataceae bacterium]
MVKLSSYLRRMWLVLMLAAVLVLLVVSCIVAPLGPRDLAALRQQRVALEATRDRLLSDSRDLTSRIARLRSDDAFIQRRIRSELGYARADELVYRFPADDGDTAR